MLGNFGQKKTKRIALIAADGLSVFVLYKGQLHHDAKFSDEDIGHANFRNYLAERAPTPITLLVDSVAEDFLVESLPHVSYYDRKGFLNRKAEGHFRGLEYRSSSIVGRESAGRKNDKVLFSALTKNQIIEPWIRVMLQEEIPIQGITTPAFALCKVAEHYKLLSKRAALIVNWEKTGIRQTFVADKRMMFSRLSQVSGYGGSGDLAAEIIDTCVQTKDYIERIGLLKFDQSLDLHIITPQLNDDDFSNLGSTGSFFVVRHYRPADLMAADAFHGDEDAKTAVLLCLEWGVRTGQLSNRYAPPTVRRFYELGQIRRLLGFTSLASLLISAGVSFPLLMDAAERNNRVAALELQIAPIRSQYDSLTAQFPETPIPSDAMSLAVGNYQLITSQIHNPVELMQQVSAVVARFPSVQISSFRWQLSGDDGDSEIITPALLAGDAVASIDLIGTISGGNSIANSQRQLGVFVQALDSISGATAAPISLPVESGPDGEVSTVINDEAVNAEFAISVRMES